MERESWASVGLMWKWRDTADGRGEVADMVTCQSLLSWHRIHLCGAGLACFPFIHKCSRMHSSIFIAASANIQS